VTESSSVEPVETESVETEPVETRSFVPVPDGPDAGLPWHYGDPFGEQRRLSQGQSGPAGVWAHEALRIAVCEPRAGVDPRPAPGETLRLVHLDGSADEPLPPVGTVLTLNGRRVGRLGTSAQHYELGPIGLAALDASVPAGASLMAGSTAALLSG